MPAQILLYDGFDELDAVAPYEVLQVAAAVGAPGRTELVALDGAPEVTGAYGLRLRPQARLEPVSRPDLLLVPGGGWITRVTRGSALRWRAASSRPRWRRATTPVPPWLRFARAAFSSPLPVCSGAARP